MVGVTKRTGSPGDMDSKGQRDVKTGFTGVPREKMKKSL